MTSRFRCGLSLFLMLATAGTAGAEVVGLPSWDVVPSPTSDSGSSKLLGVAAVSASEVWAVGSRGNKTLTARWDGTRFRVVSSPNPRDRAGVLEDVAGTGPANVWAVGHSDSIDFVGSRTLIVRWNGSTWSRVPSPNLGAIEDENVLSGVAVIAANDAWAVGWYRNIDPASARAVTLHWNGSTWTRIANQCGPALREVFALSATEVWAVGGNSTCRWNGSTWTRYLAAQGPNPNLAIDLQDISGTSSNNLWAVGLASSSCGEGLCFTGVIERWNGSAWSFRSTGAILYGVHAIAPNNIYAVGLGRGPTILHYDGTWAQVPTPTPIPIGRLFAIDAFSADRLWAVGLKLVDGKEQMLAEQAPSSKSGAVVGRTGVGNATVSWFGPETGSVDANQFGQYQIGGLKIGTYTLVGSSPGCSPASKKVTVPAGTTISLSLILTC
jgi:hypothetical protein